MSGRTLFTTALWRVAADSTPTTVAPVYHVLADNVDAALDVAQLAHNEKFGGKKLYATSVERLYGVVGALPFPVRP